MTPTNKLRWLRRYSILKMPPPLDMFEKGMYKIDKSFTDDVNVCHTVLQQWWEDESQPMLLGGEWRDVPVEEET